jgi:N utilization substance protein A
LGRATVIVDEDQLSLAIGKRGQNVRLAARLTGWDIDLVTPAEYDKNIDDMESVLKDIDGVEDVVLDKLLAIGVVSLADLPEVGKDPLMNELGLDEPLAEKIIEIAGEAAKRIAVEVAAKKAEDEAKKAEERAAMQAGGSSESQGESAGEDATEQASMKSSEVQPVADSSPEAKQKREAAIVADLAADWRSNKDEPVENAPPSAETSEQK